jgi:tyrosyl-tRNA synthetase
MKKLIEELKFRELLKDIANEESLASIVENNGSFYIGIDPTADSIHVGHFLTLSLARILNSHGLKPILVIGGFTGMIGDPSGRNSEREVIDGDLVKNNVKLITEQLLDLSNKMGIKDVEVFDNSKIYESMSIIDLFQKYGKLFNINNMLNKESVQNRIENGISYTEFSYQLFQAIDFLYLYENKGVSLELGGSDQ